MGIVGGFDIHRRQITFDYLDERSGETRHGRIAPADRMLLRGWLQKLDVDAGTPAAFAWRGAPAGGSWSRSCSAPGSRRIWPSRPIPPPRAGRNAGPRPTAPTPGCCVTCSPTAGCPSRGFRRRRCFQMRARLQLFRDLREQHTGWVQRIHAILLHHGVPAVSGGLLSLDNRRRLEAGEGLSPAGRQAVATALRILDALDAELDPLRRQIAAFADR